jgi:uncharacterized membrane protein
LGQARGSRHAERRDGPHDSNPGTRGRRTFAEEQVLSGLLLARTASDASGGTQPSLTSSIVGLLFMFAVIVAILWAWMWSRRNRAVNELRDRYAKGEIDQTEFEARMDDLRQQK